MEALAEAARLETARIYSRMQREHKQETAGAVEDSDTFDQLIGAVRAGWSNSRIMGEFCVDYVTVQRARKIVRKRSAA